MSGDSVKFEGLVIEARGNANFLVAVGDKGTNVLCTLSGKIRKNSIKILEGDKVAIEVSPYDMTRGRITYRYRK